jgi:signal transduction histidine kinase
MPFAVLDKTKFMADPAYIRRIITNLSTNAIQAMPNGGKLIIDARKLGREIQITVSDTGEGIPDSTKDKIFKPLFTTKSKGQGFG